MKTKQVREQKAINEHIFNTFIKTDINQRLDKFIKDNKDNLYIELESIIEPTTVKLSQVTNENAKIRSLAFETLYFNRENYYNYIDKETELREIKTYELVNKFLDENEELKPLINYDYYIYDEHINYRNEEFNKGYKEYITEMIVESILDKVEPNFFELLKDRITITIK